MTPTNATEAMYTPVHPAMISFPPPSVHDTIRQVVRAYPAFLLDDTNDAKNLRLMLFYIRHCTDTFFAYDTCAFTAAEMDVLVEICFVYSCMQSMKKVMCYYENRESASEIIERLDLHQKPLRTVT